MSGVRYAGGIAVEDEGIFFSVSEVEQDGAIHGSSPIFKCKRPDSGYTLEFIETAVPALVEQCSLHLSAVGISTFGLVRPDDAAAMPNQRRDQLIGVPRYDWKSKFESPFVFKDIRPEWEDIPVFVENDSTAWAMTEYWELEEKERCDSFVYVRVGAGVGAGALMFGMPRLGNSHPEVGHIPVTKLKGDSLRKTTCQAHTEYDCLEGMISEGAILNRCKNKYRALEEIPGDHPVWDIVAEYIVQMCGTLAMVLAPDRIMLGGRTMKAGGKTLFNNVRLRYGPIIKGYPRYEKSGLSDYFLKKGRVWEYGSLHAATCMAANGIVRQTTTV